MSLELETADTDPSDLTPPTTPTGIAPPEPSQPGGHTLPPADPEAEARQQFVELARSCVGLSAEPDKLDRYLDALMWNPQDRASTSVRRGFALASSCALFAMRLLDRAGVQHPILTVPYVDQTAPADIARILADLRASRGPHYRPRLGDIVLIDSGWHALIVTGINGDVYETCQGGERVRPGDKTSAECIALVSRTYHASPPRFDGRPILDVGDCLALAACEAYVPPGALGQG